MQKIATNVYLENKYIGVNLGLVITGEGLLLVDSPLHTEEVNEWFKVVSERGQPKFLILLDSHPDRVLGSRTLKLPAIAQDQTLKTIREWADTFKGNAHPIGAEADQLKRITGVNNAIPEITFSERMVIHMGGKEIVFLHRPGPRPGSMWMVIPDLSVVFVGDTVTIDEPPYFGVSDIEAWLNSLDELRGSDMKSYTLISSCGGRINRKDINHMARFLRKVQSRVEKLDDEKNRDEEIERLAIDLMGDFSIRSIQEDLILKRLKTGLLDQSLLQFPDGT
ncbi:MAG: MBL fold metallo-hydrolase [Anaerolineales bacterium]|nr:MAG: MBL fold metallo-hydrolase [Anaerolineales bacterium]